MKLLILSLLASLTAYAHFDIQVNSAGKVTFHKLDFSEGKHIQKLKTGITKVRYVRREAGS